MICPFSKFKKTRNYARTIIDPDLIVIHYTETFTAKEALLVLEKRKLSAHFVISPFGKVIQLVDTSYKAWHAGKSCFKDRRNVNDFSIGVELVNPGFLKDGKKWKSGYTKHLDKKWANWPEQQIQTLTKLISWIQKQHPKCLNVVGHSDIAPERKIDPGPIFPWFKLKNIRPCND
tara:strand:- start:1994 stop:2518 length:525 start_codon:yes stop_codon:yes gene_type:complete